MNNFDKDFLDELANLDCDMPQPDDAQLMRIHALCLKKANVKLAKKPTKAIVFARILATAAVAIFAVLGMGTTYIKATDYFKTSLLKSSASPNTIMADTAAGTPVLPEEKGIEKATSFSMDARQYESQVAPMSTLIEQKVTDGNVEITSQAAMGDNDTLMVILDAKSLSPDITFRDGIRLQDITLRVNDSISGSSYEQSFYNAELQEIGPSGMARFLIKEKVQQNFLGKDATLSIQTISGRVKSNGEILAFDKNLFDKFTDINKTSTATLTPNYMTEAEKTALVENNCRVAYDKDGKAVWGYQLSQISAQQVEKHANTTVPVITDILVQNGSLYANLILPKTYVDVQNIVLKNPSTNTVLYGGVGISHTESGNYSLSVNIEGITKPEDLKNYIFAINAGEIYMPLATGNWKFNIPVHFTDMSTNYTLDKEIVITENDTINVSSVAVSPISLTIRGKVTKGDYENAFLFGSTKLVMADGKTLELCELTSSYDYSTAEYDIQFILPSVIEPQNLKAVKVDDFMIELLP